MKIATITFHNVYNYGAVLQAYALCRSLEKAGHEVQVLDYRPEAIERQYNYWKKDDSFVVRLKKGIAFQNPYAAKIQAPEQAVLF